MLKTFTTKKLKKERHLADQAFDKVTDLMKVKMKPKINKLNPNEKLESC